MFDFLRSTHGTVVAFVGFGLLVYMVCWVLIRGVSRSDDPGIATLIRRIKFWRNTILVVAGVGLVAVLANMALVNVTPRAAIDRTSVEKQADDYEQRVKEEAAKEKK